MVEVEQGHPNVTRIVAEHEIPELLSAADVEYVYMPVDGLQQREKEIESLPPHSRGERTTVTVVRQRPDERATRGNRRRPRRRRHAGASSSGAEALALLGAVSRCAIVTIVPANQK